MYDMGKEKEENPSDYNKLPAVLRWNIIQTRNKKKK